LLGLVVIAVTAYLAIDLGLVDSVRNVGAEGWLNDKKVILQSKIELKGESIDRSLKIVGLAFTIVLGVLAFLKGWHYAEANLPLRLQQYADRIKETHLHERAVFLVPYTSRNLKGDVTPVASRNFLYRVISLVRLDPASRFEQRILDTVPVLDGDIRVLGAKLGTSNAQRITGHLIVASKLVEEARSMQSGSSAQASRYADALAQVNLALKLDENDLGTGASGKVGKVVRH